MNKSYYRIIGFSISFFILLGQIFAETPYEKYKNVLLTRYGISFSFPDTVAVHYPHFNNPETQPSIVFNELDTTTGFTFYTFDAVVKLSPDVCILISNILDHKTSFKSHEFYINDSKVTLDNIKFFLKVSYFAIVTCLGKGGFTTRVRRNDYVMNAVLIMFKEVPRMHG